LLREKREADGGHTTTISLLFFQFSSLLLEKFALGRKYLPIGGWRGEKLGRKTVNSGPAGQDRLRGVAHFQNGGPRPLPKWRPRPQAEREARWPRPPPQRAAVGAKRGEMAAAFPLPPAQDGRWGMKPWGPSWLRAASRCCHGDGPLRGQTPPPPKPPLWPWLGGTGPFLRHL